jgi:hypothetical protein
MWTCPNCNVRNWDADTHCHRCKRLLLLDRASAAKSLGPAKRQEPAVPQYPPLMSPAQIDAFERFRAYFEGKEAILAEKGLLRVRVFDVRPGHRQISVGIEEIPTPGLGVGLFEDLSRRSPAPLRMRLGGGGSCDFSRTRWYVGYGAGSLLFWPRTIASVIERAAQFPEGDGWQRYRRVCDGMEMPPFERSESLFPDDEEQEVLIRNAAPVRVRSSGERVYCPRCGVFFKTIHPSVWDGERHLRCGQCLIIDE